MEYVLHVCILVCLYVGLAKSLDLLAGQTGILSVAHAGFFGVGAYSCALLVTLNIVTWPVGFVIAIIFGATVAIPIALPSLRLAGDYFVLTTFAFQMLLASVLNNWTSVTHGPLGISGIPVPTILGFAIDTRWKELALVLTLVGVAFAVLDILRTSPFGRVLRAIREDEALTRSWGRAVGAPKLKAFAISAGIAAGLGAIYAHYLSYIDPSSFTVLDSILVLAMVTIGGSDSRWGPLAGALGLVMLPELLRFTGISGGSAAHLRELAYGVLLVVMVFVRSSRRSVNAMS